jgi:hypothetical protein
MGKDCHPRRFSISRPVAGGHRPVGGVAPQRTPGSPRSPHAARPRPRWGGHDVPSRPAPLTHELTSGRTGVAILCLVQESRPCSWGRQQTAGLLLPSAGERGGLCPPDLSHGTGATASHILGVHPTSIPERVGRGGSRARSAVTCASWVTVPRGKPSGRAGKALPTGSIRVAAWGSGLFVSGPAKERGAP